MMKLLIHKRIAIFTLAFLLPVLLFSQVSEKAFSYQAVVRNNTGTALKNRDVNVKTQLLSGSSTGTLQWEETFNTRTDSSGRVIINIGKGVNTGKGVASSFDQVDFSLANHYLAVHLDTLLNGTYYQTGTAELFSVPYALSAQYAVQSLDSVYLPGLWDADTLSLDTGDLLYFDGITWKNNSVAFSADTAMYSYYSGNSGYSDTASVASGGYSSQWQLGGNTTGGNNFYVGTADSTSFYLGAGNTSYFKIGTVDNFSHLTSLSDSISFKLDASDLLLMEGTLSSGIYPADTSNTKFIWYPGKAAFRAGMATNNYWDDVNTGTYSAAFGKNNKASGNNSFVTGSNNIASGNNAAVFGYQNTGSATGSNQYGTSVTMGDSCFTPAKRSVSMGMKSEAKATTTIAIGYKAIASNNISLAIGNNVIASGPFSAVIGNYAAAGGNRRSFVFGDNSTTSYITSSSNYQFVTRASGGTIFYTDSGSTMGVLLASGSGAWSSISDRNLKENIELAPEERILEEVSKLPLQSWEYKSEKGIKHIGPTAQGFCRAFGLGESMKWINTVDIDGVNLIATKALADKFRELNKTFDRVDEIEEKIKTLDYKELETRLNKLEKEFE